MPRHSEFTQHFGILGVACPWPRVPDTKVREMEYVSIHVCRPLVPLRQPESNFRVNKISSDHVDVTLLVRVPAAHVVKEVREFAVVENERVLDVGV